MGKTKQGRKNNSHYLEIHRRAVVVDGHSDLMIDICRRQQKGEKALFRRKYVDELKKGGVRVVVLSTGGDSPSHNMGSEDPLTSTLKGIQSVHRENEDSRDVVSLCTTMKDMEKALASGKVALFMMIEGGRPLREDVGMVELYYRLGVRSIQLTWNGRNQLGDGCGESETKSKLSRFGKAVIREMNRLKMVVDVSHASESTFYSAAEVAQSPMIVSHANARALCDHVRNLTDEQIKLVARMGGVIGMCFFPKFVDLKKPSLKRMVDHVDYIADLVGVDSISLGPDYIDYALDIFVPNLKSGGQGTSYGDEFQFPKGIENVKVLPNFTRELLQRGYSEGDIEKILGKNLLRVYRQVIG